GASKDVDVGDDATVDLGQPELAPELDRLPGLVAGDDGGVGLDQAHQLLRSGYRFTPEHAPFGLVDDPTRQWHQPIQLAHEALRSGIWLGVFGCFRRQSRSDALGLADDRAGDATEPGIGGPPSGLAGLTLPPCQPMNPLELAPSAP